MKVATPYISRMPDASGHVHYTEDENRIWAELYARQRRTVEDRACAEFIHGLEMLNLPQDRVPQLPDVSRALARETSWEVVSVPALIPNEQFFALLSQKKFPAATFVRRREDLDYLQEPDVFHELFGHAPMLTNRYFADFNETYGRLALAASESEREFLARLYWFTVEFGLIHPPGKSLRIYGGGVLSSIGETEYALSGRPQVRRLYLPEALRTPYRIDIMQPAYFAIEDLRELYEMTRNDLMTQVHEAQRRGLHAPLFQAAA